MDFIIIFLIGIINMSKLGTPIDNTKCYIILTTQNFDIVSTIDSIYKIRQYNKEILDKEAFIEEKIQLTFDNLKKKLYYKTENSEELKVFFKTFLQTIHSVVESNSIFKQGRLSIEQILFFAIDPGVLMTLEEFKAMQNFLIKYEKSILAIKNSIKAYDLFFNKLHFLYMTDECYTCVEALNEVIICINPGDDVVSSCKLVLDMLLKLK
ncbi:hypothetical protein AAJ76_3500010795 [Vairimorpha ceranae]|uniref:Uncharacterized protein n=1 Tax=Vairimorpha ceranae TaxID=40302 RepID=A0A0F9ZBF5_9MICR|nr:hypothetical protein AAJ76_3500010795 [Vairimorpha ceranae]KAF5139973.1 hypothetical protein G9O61_00g018930 [Vairimorpha ceranae]KKO75024.1 hypothetical protein AAJ76_3500010795 [Vairimorpha ceranae]